MLYLNKQSRNFSVQAPWLTIDGIHLKDTSLRLMGDIDNVDVFLATSSSDSTLNNTLFAEGNFILGAEPFFQILVETFNFPIGEIIEKLKPDLSEEIIGKLKPFVINAQGYLSSDLDKFSFNASQFNLNNAQNPDEYLSLSFAGNNAGLSFRSLDLHYSGIELTGDGTADWQEEGSLNFITNLIFQDIPYPIQGTFIPGDSLYLEGDYGLEGRVSFLKSALLLDFQATKFPIPYQGDRIIMDLNLKGDFTSLENWHLLIEQASVLDFPLDSFGERYAEISLNGRFSPREGQIYNVSYSDDYSLLKGNGELQYNFADNDSASGGWIQLYDEQTREEYLLELEILNKILSGRFELIDFPLQRLGDNSMYGFLTARGVVGGPIESPTFELNLELNEGMLNDVPINFSSKLTLLEDSLKIETLNLSYLNNKIYINSGVYHLSNGNITLPGNFSGTLKENPLTAGFSVNVSVLPIKSKFDSPVIFSNTINAVVNVEDIYIFDQPHASWQLNIDYSNDQLIFHGGPQNTINGFYDFNNGFEFQISEPMPMNFKASGKLSEGMIDASLKDISMDFQTIEKYFSIPGFTLLSGEANGELQIKGPVTDPDLFGMLDITNLTAKLSFMKNTLNFNTTRIVADKKTLYVENIVIQPEEGAAILNCEFTLDHLAPYYFSIYIETVTNQDPYLSFTFPFIIAEGNAQGSIAIDGTMNELKVNGDLAVHSGHVTVDTGYKEEKKSKMDFLIDITIGIGNNNTFYWPSRRVPILKAYAESGNTIHVFSDSAKNNFELKGEVGVKGGEIFYFRRNFYLQNGIIVFNETQDRFNPILDAKALIREVDQNGELYKIYLIADNMPLNDFSPRFESDPYLTNQEIVTMLGANLFNSEENEVTLNEAILLTSDVVSQFSFMQNLQESVKNLLGLDVFSLRSQIVPNLIIERFLPEEGGGFDASFARYLDNTTLFVGKYLGNDLFLQGVMQMDYYDANPVDDLYFAPRFNIDTEVTLEWDSPVALIELSLYPDLFDPTDALLTSSLRLSWMFSF